MAFIFLPVVFDWLITVIMWVSQDSDQENESVFPVHTTLTVNPLLVLVFNNALHEHSYLNLSIYFHIFIL